MIRSLNCVVWILYIVCSLSRLTYAAFFCVNVTQVLFKPPPLPLSSPSVELFCSPMWDYNTRLYSFLLESFFTYSCFYVVWTRPLLFSFIFMLTLHLTALWIIFILTLFNWYLIPLTNWFFFSTSCEITFRIFKQFKSYLTSNKFGRVLC